MRIRTSNGARIAVALVLASQAALLAFVIAHNLSTAAAPSNSDFASAWLGSTVWRISGPTHAYDVHAQALVYAHAASTGSRAWAYPSTWAPASLLLTIPFSLLPLGSAFVAWEALQLASLITGACIAVWVCAPRVAIAPRTVLAAAAVLGAGTIGTLLFGQWDGVAALGVALAYALWLRGHDGRAAIVLTFFMLAGKPHLGLGLLAFAALRGGWRGIAGVAAGCGLSALVAVALVGPAGIEAWLSTVNTIATLPAIGSLGIFGLAANVVGTGTTASVVATALAVLLVAAAGVLGHASSRRMALETALLGATCASLLASPHLFNQDLALLVPVVAAMLARHVSHKQPRAALLVVLAAGVISLAAEYQILPLGAQRADVWLPLALLCVVAWSCRGLLLRPLVSAGHSQELAATP